MAYLNVGAVYDLLKIFQSNNIMVHVTANLNQPVKAMSHDAVRANTDATVQAEHVLLILLCALVDRAWHEEFLAVQRFQPCRLLNSLQQ